jgi:hypothetical protein
VGTLCGSCAANYSQAALSQGCVADGDCSGGALFAWLASSLSAAGAAYLLLSPVESSGLVSALVFFFQSADVLLLGAAASSTLDTLTGLFALRLRFTPSSSDASGPSGSTCAFRGLSTLQGLLLPLLLPAAALSLVLLLLALYSLRRRCCGRKRVTVVDNPVSSSLLLHMVLSFGGLILCCVASIPARLLSVERFACL